MQKQINGILLLDKPPGITSNHALQKVKRLFQAKKAGHTGSLDPIATGMLPICFGQATKFSQFLLSSDKHYYATARLGVTTTTGDCEGEIVAKRSIESITASAIEAVLNDFIGESEQIPPMYSALKYHGKPLYELARAGIEVEREARKINIYSLTIENWNGREAQFHVHCSKGTYVRTLIADIGERLACGAHVVGLRRSMVSMYQQAAMHTLDSLEKIASDGAALSACLLPMESAVEGFPEVKLTTAAAFYLRTGQSVRASSSLLTNEFVRLISE
ncbi:MAG: tRNA pseudouridine(55) synthase TruB, partial [Gammaproteobacteria bacterium RIFCSPHIGHO2_12_FULL_38_14]